MVKRGELTDEAWARIAPLLPANGRRGGRWRDHREVVDGGYDPHCAGLGAEFGVSSRMAAILGLFVGRARLRILRTRSCFQIE